MASEGYSTEAKRRNFVFDSSIDWKPEQSAKMKCNVICPGSFEDQASCIILSHINGGHRYKQQWKTIDKTTKIIGYS